MNRNTLSISYIDNREFTSAKGTSSGPLGYQIFALSDWKVATYVAFLMFPLNQWLADGLLVGSLSNSAAKASNVTYFFSCTAAL